MAKRSGIARLFNLRSIVRFVFLLFIASGVALYFFGGVIVTELSRRGFEKIQYYLVRYRFHDAQIWFDAADYSFPDQIEWSGVGIHFRYRDRKGSRPFLGEVDSLKVAVKSLSPGQLEVVAQGIELKEQGGSEAPADTEQMIGGISKVNADYFRAGLFVDVNDLRGSLKKVIEGLAPLLRGESVEQDVDFSGTFSFNLRGEPFTLRLLLAKNEKGGKGFIIPKEDMAKIEDVLGEDLTSSEISVLSRNPGRVGRLLAIKERVEDDSKSQAARTPGLVEDAHRHVLWSYLLAKEFGAEFAQKVTDAHESEETDLLDSKMDQRNNAAGRGYAQQNLSESDIIQRVLNAPEIARSKEDAQSEASKSKAEWSVN